MNVTRRQVLRMGLIPLLLAVMTRRVATVLTIGDDFAGEWAKSLDCFRALFTDLGPPRDVGRRYLASFPKERNRAFLQGAVTGESRPQDAMQLRALLAQRREHDFRTGDIAIVDGWILSRTEARACALVALL